MLTKLDKKFSVLIDTISNLNYKDPLSARLKNWVNSIRDVDETSR